MRGSDPCFSKAGSIYKVTINTGNRNDVREKISVCKVVNITNIKT